MTTGKQQTMWLEHENRSGLGHRKVLTDKVRKVGRGLWLERLEGGCGVLRIILLFALRRIVMLVL